MVLINNQRASVEAVHPAYTPESCDARVSSGVPFNLRCIIKLRFCIKLKVNYSDCLLIYSLISAHTSFTAVKN